MEMYLVLALLFSAVSTTVTGTYEYGTCKFVKHIAAHSQLARLKPLVNKRYSTPYDTEDEYVYYVGICTKASLEAKDDDNAGVIQQNKKTKENRIIGRTNDAEFQAGTEWLLLEYENGEAYHSHCNSEKKRAQIMIICKPGETQGQLRIIEENNNKTSDCYYLFELEHEAACKKHEPRVYGLSIGSVIVIIFFTLLGVYLIGGFIYMRFVVHARGMNQMPNWSFWQDFGNLQADGCNFLCRCTGGSPYNQPGQRTYKGVGDDQLGLEDEGPDDHLLPM